MEPGSQSSFFFPSVFGFFFGEADAFGDDDADDPDELPSSEASLGRLPITFAAAATFAAGVFFAVAAAFAFPALALAPSESSSPSRQTSWAAARYHRVSFVLLLPSSQ